MVVNSSDTPKKMTSLLLNRKYTTLVLDLGGVLANYTTKNIVGLSASQIKAGLDSPYWYDYEKNNTSEYECYESICNEFNINFETWTEALEQMREGLQPNTTLISHIRELRQLYPEITVFCLSNIPVSEYNALRGEIESWGIIDKFIASSAIKQRKPDLGTYTEFLKIIQASASSCVFIDDKTESVIAAQSLGFKGIVFQDTDALVRDLHNLFGDPIARAKAFLKRNAKNLFCTLSTGQLQPDNYSQLIILQNTGDRDLVVLEHEGHSWNYFQRESPTLAPKGYPNDSDTTSLALAVLENVPTNYKVQARDEILSHLNPDGLPLCWFSKVRPRFCHCICANVFRFFVINDWFERLPGVYEFLCSLLTTRAYLHGSRYYKNPDWFLYILSDLCARRPADFKIQSMRELLVQHVQERMGCDGNILGAAMRALSAQSLDLQCDRELEILLEGQQLDGGWELAWLWEYGSKSLQIGGRGVVTAMALNAIQRVGMRHNKAQ